jgi:phosphatidylglycerol---prolipoprotein diacylglyceryl transferase
MHPVLFQIGGVPIYSHGVFMLAGLLVGLGMLTYETQRRRWPPGEAAPIVLATFVGGMIGARLSILFLNGPQTAPVVLNFFALFDLHVGPGSILGAVIGGYVAGFLMSRMLGQSRCVCDAFAPAMAIAMVIGRVGCYLAGEDGLGKATTLAWGVYLPGASEAVHQPRTCLRSQRRF